MEVLRKATPARWTLDIFTVTGDVVPLTSLDLEFPVAQPYDGILSPAE